MATVTIRLQVHDLKRRRKAQGQTTALCFRKADFGLFRDLPGRIPWDTSLERMSLEELQASPAPPGLEKVMKKFLLEPFTW